MKTKSTGMKKKRIFTVAKTTRITKPIKSDYLQYSQLLTTNSINKLIKDLPPLSQNCCIYRVPPKVRNLNKKVYTPQVVSIGPFHHGKPNLQAMEEHKLRYLRAFLQRSPCNCSLLEHCEKMIRGWEKDIRNSYAETFKLTSDQFVEIVLIDSCFVVEAILSYSDPTDRRSFYIPKSNFLYETDMMLLENQLPFFVLDGLYQLAFPDEPKTNFLEYCIKYFFYRMLIKVDAETLIAKVEDYVGASRHQILHFVDLLRVCHLPSKLRPLSDKKSDMDQVTITMVPEIQEFGIELKKSSIDLVTIPKVTQIQESGIELKKSKSICPLDIEYTHAVLEIPQVVVDEASEYLLSNILVLEMCHYKEDSYLRDYVFFMDMLIDSSKDVDLLIHSGIVVSWTRHSCAVAHLFNNVGYNFPLVGSRYYFYRVSQNLKEYCRVPRHRWKAAFMRDYCSTPWIIASTTAAVILLLLTFVQTLSSVGAF